MTGRRATVSSEYLRLVATGAEMRGLDVEPTFTSIGLDPAVLGRRGARVDADVAREAWRRIVQRLGDPIFGLRLAETLPLGAMTMLDYLVMSSANVGEALGLVARYGPLMSEAETMSLVVEGREARFRIENGNDIPYPVEMILGMFLRRTREFFGPAWSLNRASFAHPAQGPRATYDRICHAPVEFEAPFTEAVFERELLEMPMVGADSRLNAVLIAQAEGALATLASSAVVPSFVDTVRRVLEEGLHARDLTLTRLAGRLGISVRTLQRRLRAAGVTHRGLVRSVREDVATRSLASPVSQGQLARTLGYSGPGAFRRAFKRWSGMSPGQVRRRA